MPEPRSVEEWAETCRKSHYVMGTLPICLDCARAYAAQVCAALQQKADLLSRIVNRLPLCPDHRDKVRDICVECSKEVLRQRVEALKRATYHFMHMGYQNYCNECKEAEAALRGSQWPQTKYPSELPRDEEYGRMGETK